MWTIDAVLTGKTARFTDDGATSAIAKRPATGALKVGSLGIEGDEQADRSVHGGPDKAIHHYPRDHYLWWQSGCRAARRPSRRARSARISRPAR